MSGRILKNLDTVGCLGGECPTVYQDETDGTIFIQGYKLDEDSKNNLSIKNNEEIIELSPVVIEMLRKNGIV
jgi:hypothetical protein